MSTIGFVGGGNMAEALIKGIISAGVYQPAEIFASDVRTERLKYLAKSYGIATLKANRELAGKVELLVLSVKPQNMPDVLAELAGAVRADTLVVSIAASIKVANITAALGDLAVVRVMPNTPALIGQGASVLFANARAKAMLLKALRIFSAVGIAVGVESEELIDAVTAVAGSGPAYFFLLIEQMIEAAKSLGLDDKIAVRLVLQTAKGAALLAVEADGRGEGPAELRRKVTSPGGTTEAALRVLADGNFGGLVARAIERACQRSRELSK